MTDSRTAGPATLNDLILHLQTLADQAVQETAPGHVSSGYRDGNQRAWAFALSAARRRHEETAPDWVTPLNRLHKDLDVELRHLRSDTTRPITFRAGATDALTQAAVEVTHAVSRGEALNAEGLHNRLAAVQAASATEDLADWSRYPRVPVAEVRSMHELCLFLGGDPSSFTGELLRLIAKADPVNLQRLSSAFPRHVAVFLMWRAVAPVSSSRLVQLLEAAHAHIAPERSHDA